MIGPIRHRELAPITAIGPIRHRDLAPFTVMGRIRHRILAPISVIGAVRRRAHGLQKPRAMKRTPLLLLLSFLTVSEVHAQAPRNAGYIELGGSAIGASFNYERRLTEKWLGRAGLSWVTGDSGDDTDTTFLVPLTVSTLSRPASNHHLELGGGITVIAGDRQDLWGAFDDDEKVSTALLTGIVGYRYQKPAGGFQFRAVFTPLAGEGGVVPWAGVSFGYAW